MLGRQEQRLEEVVGQVQGSMLQKMQETNRLRSTAAETEADALSGTAAAISERLEREGSSSSLETVDRRRTPTTSSPIAWTRRPDSSPSRRSLCRRSQPISRPSRTILGRSDLHPSTHCPRLAGGRGGWDLNQWRFTEHPFGARRSPQTGSAHGRARRL
jgi:hypothetical protein